MPARLIRDDMLDSERVQTLPIEARWLYLTVLLTADDVGLFEASCFKLGRRAGIDQNKVPVLLQLLADSDLIRCYEAEGKRFGFIPRFRQRLQIKRTRHPMPPSVLMADDQDAVIKIKHLAENPPLETRGPPLLTVAHPPEPEPEPEEEKEGTDVPSRQTQALDGRYRVPECPHGQLLDAFHESLPTLPRVVVFNSARKAPLQARWREVCASERFDQQAGVAWFQDLFRMLGKSAFLTGRTGKFKASFDWITAPRNFAKCVEGNYQQEAA